MRNVIIVLLFLLVLSLEATNGSAFLGIGPKQSAVAGAGVAKPEDSTWLALNPAGLVELESRVDSSLEFVVTQRKADMQGILAGDLSETENTTSYIPQVSAFWKLNEDEGFGLGFFSVGGVSTHFSKSRSALGQVGDFDRNIYFATSKLIVSYSRRLSNGWSFGFAPSIVHSTFKSDIMTGDLVQTNGDNDARSTFGGGYSLSAYKKWERLSFGFKYTSRQWTEQYEEYDDIVLRPLDHPRHLQVGFAYAVNEGLDLLIDYKWFDWDSVKQLGKSAANGGFGWSDQHIYKLGLVWQLSSNLTLRAGYSYGKSPLGDEDVFANALFAAPVEHHAACGFTYELGDSMELSMAYVHGFKNGFRENNKDIPLGGGSEVSLSLDQLTIGFAWRF